MKTRSSISKISNNAFIFIIWFFIASIYMLFVSHTTSPLYFSKGQDSSVFMMIGNEILNGKVPYVDLFENKGPLLYFIEALPQIFIKGNIGIWILQVSLLLVTLTIIHDIGKKIVGKSAFVFPLFYLSILTFSMEGGNLSEEYSIFFSWVCVWLFVNIITSNDKRIPLFYGFIFGLCFGAVTLIRINDVSTIIGVILTLFILHIVEKRYVCLAKSLITFLLGMLLIILPVTLYYYFNNALYEMLYGYLGINLKYSSLGNTEYSLISRIQMVSPMFVKIGLFSALVGCVGSLINLRGINRKYFAVFLLVSSILTFLSVFISTSGYLHYLISLSLPFVMGTMFIGNEIKNIFTKYYKYLSIIGVTVAVLIGGYYSYQIIPSHSDINSYARQSLELSGFIPDNDRDSVYALGIGSKWYQTVDILPDYKHFLPITYMNIDPDISSEIDKYFEKTPPSWLILSEDIDVNQTLTETTVKNIKNKYKFVYENEIGRMYKLKNN
jgi:hypothetical protein